MKRSTSVDKYECTICGYVYDPEKGDPEHGIKPGTPFDALPDDWTCPLCGAAQDMFEKVE
jgi:rubredoxin